MPTMSDAGRTFRIDESKPFEPEVRRRTYLGTVAAADDKGQAFIQVKAFEYLVKNDLLRNNVKFIFEGEEEIGSPVLKPSVKSTKNY